MFLFDLNLHNLAQLVDTVQTEAFGKVIVGFCFDRLADFANNDIESCRLALQGFHIVIGGKSNVDYLFVVGFQPNKLVFKTGDQLTRADFDRHAFAFSAFKRYAVNLAFEIDDSNVTG